MRTWELRLFRRFPPAIVVTAFLASFLASFRSRAALQLESPGFLPGDHRSRPSAAGPTRRPRESAGAGTDRRSGAWAQDTRQDRRHGRGQPYGRKQSEVLNTPSYGHRVAGTTARPTAGGRAGRGGPSGRWPPSLLRTPGGVKPALPLSSSATGAPPGLLPPRAPAARGGRAAIEGPLRLRTHPLSQTAGDTVPVGHRADLAISRYVASASRYSSMAASGRTLLFRSISASTL
jgi:hypothetical protein